MAPIVTLYHCISKSFWPVQRLVECLNRLLHDFGGKGVGAFHGLGLDCYKWCLDRSGTERVGMDLFMERLAPDWVGMVVALER